MAEKKQPAEFRAIAGVVQRAKEFLTTGIQPRGGVAGRQNENMKAMIDETGNPKLGGGRGGGDTSGPVNGVRKRTK